MRCRKVRAYRTILSKHGTPLHTVTRPRTAVDTASPDGGCHDATAQFVNCVDGGKVSSARTTLLRAVARRVLVGTDPAERSNQLSRPAGRSTARCPTTGSRTSLSSTPPTDIQSRTTTWRNNRDVQGWVQVSRTVFPGAAFTPSSEIGGTQFAIFISPRFRRQLVAQGGQRMGRLLPCGAVRHDLGLRNGATPSSSTARSPTRATAGTHANRHRAAGASRHAWATRPMRTTCASRATVAATWRSTTPPVNEFATDRPRCTPSRHT